MHEETVDHWKKIALSALKLVELQGQHFDNTVQEWIDGPEITVVQAELAQTIARSKRLENQLLRADGVLGRIHDLVTDTLTNGYHSREQMKGINLELLSYYSDEDSSYRDRNAKS